MRAIFLALLLCFAASARAQDGSLYAERAPTSYGLSLGGTAIPIAVGIFMMNHDAAVPGALLFMGGVSVGPSLGQFYNGSAGQGLLGIFARTEGEGFLIAALAESLKGFGCGLSFGGEAESCPEPNGGKITAYYLIGGLLTVGGTLYSFADIGPSIERLEKSRRRAGITPILELGNAPGSDLRLGARAWRRF